MSDQPRDRANAAAVAVLCLANPHSDDEAWHVLSELARLAAEVRSANDAAASAGTSDAVTWLRPSVELADRLEPTSPRWASGALFPWTVWDQSAAEAFGRELGELYQLAADAASATELSADTEQHRANGCRTTDEHQSAPRPRHEKPAWAPALGLAAAVVAGVIGVLAETPAHPAASATPARTSGPAHGAASRQDLIPRQRTIATATAPAPRQTERLGQAPIHRSGRATNPAPAPTASRLTQAQDRITAAVTQQTDQLLHSALRQFQQQENLNLQHSTSKPEATPSGLVKRRLGEPAVRQAARHRRTR